MKEIRSYLSERINECNFSTDQVIRTESDYKAAIVGLFLH